MAFVVKLDPKDAEDLRQLAARERRSMHDVVVLAVQERLEAARRSLVLDALYDEVAHEDAELLERLSQ